MEFKKLAEIRESCRSYNPNKPVDRALMEEILVSTTNSPSACNSQPWKFVACDGEVAAKIPDLIIRDDLKINLWTTEVPNFVVVCETKAKLMSSLKCDSQFYAQMDLGLAISTLCYAAADNGVGTCIIGVFDEEKLKEILNIPEEIKVRAIVAMGYPKEEGTREKFRKPAVEAFSFNSFQ